MLVVPPYHKTKDKDTDYEEMRNIVRNNAKEYGYTLIDLRYEMGVNHLNCSEYMIDNVHWNERGNELIARLISGKLKSIQPIR